MILRLNEAKSTTLALALAKASIFNELSLKRTNFSPKDEI